MRVLPLFSCVIGLLIAATSPDLAVGQLPQQQSPIDIAGALKAVLPMPIFNYPAGVQLNAESIPVKPGTPVNDVNFPPNLPLGETETGHQIEFTTFAIPIPAPPNLPVPANATVTVGLDTYKLKELHFHQRSEHLINGRQFPMELHMVHVHVNNPQKFLAVGRWIGVGPNDNAVLEDVFGNQANPNFLALPGNVNPFNLLGLAPTDLRYYQYEGSLTTGPNPSPTPVSWMLFNEPLKLSFAQIKRFRAHASRGTVRMPHPLGVGQYVTTNIPEPSTLGLLAIAGLALVRRNKGARNRFLDGDSQNAILPPWVDRIAPPPEATSITFSTAPMRE